MDLELHIGEFRATLSLSSRESLRTFHMVSLDSLVGSIGEKWAHTDKNSKHHYCAARLFNHRKTNLFTLS